MKLAIVGNRIFIDYDKLKDFYLKNFKGITEIVSSGAKGADSLGKKLAFEFGLIYTEFSAEWDKYGKSAGFIRNKLIVENSDICLACWDGFSKGTKHTINLFKKLNKKVLILRF